MTFKKSLTRVSIDVALVLVTGRRVELAANKPLLMYLLSEFVIGRKVTLQEGHSAEFFRMILRRAALAIPELADEAVEEPSDERFDPTKMRAWFLEKCAQHGETVAFFAERMGAEPL